MLPFINGTNDSPAAQLYGEVPCTFPTVRGQVRLLAIAEGGTIEIALVDGDINDVTPEDIINPDAFPGEWIEHWDGLLRGVGHDVVLSDVRTKCPNALIIYFGFCPSLSYVSNRGRLRDFAKFQTSHQDVESDDPISTPAAKFSEIRAAPPAYPRCSGRTGDRPDRA